MKPAKVQIDNLRVRASSLSPEQARRLGQMVAQRLADARLAGPQSRRITTANVHLRSGNNRSVESMADEIVNSIRRKLS